ncbi:hypothetical protein BN1708_012459 [Verticillium longisporum]|uniref:Uncharacterized protein n=1 Tax=Verticillium longisporum TaxID=100787 RepID=A0A0G4LAE3_VERLO|nr:hypothetical protein BN1708_012459 [Verticillium longisporum]
MMLQTRLFAASQAASALRRSMALQPTFARQFASVRAPPKSSDPKSIDSSNTVISEYAAPDSTSSPVVKDSVIMRTYKPRTPGVRGPHLVDRIEYDPGRSAHIALITNQANGRKSYIVAAEGMRAGDIVQSYRSGIPKALLDSMGGVVDPGILAAKTAWRGNCLPMHMVPVGTVVYNVGSRARGPAVFCRSAGTHAIVVSKEEETKDDGTKVMTGKYVTVRLQSGEVRRVSKDACATIGVASNPHHQYRQLGKAGRSRWLNIRPTVRGLAMNSVDHPHGGGRGKSKGNRHPTSPWGTPSKGGYKTRRKHNFNKWVVEPRVRNMGKRREKASKA